MSEWRTAPICDRCWDIEEPGRSPVRLNGVVKETCCRCGEQTTSGIYVRRDVARYRKARGL